MGSPLAKTKRVIKDYRPLKCQIDHSELDTHKALMRPMKCQIDHSELETYKANMMKPCH